MIGLLVIIGAVVLGASIYLLSNNWAIAVIAGLLLFILWGYMEYMKLKAKNLPNPYEQVEKDLRRQVLKCKLRTPSYLFLSGDGLFNFIKVGKIVGTMYWTPQPTTIRIREEGKYKNVAVGDLDEQQTQIMATFKRNKVTGWDRFILIAFKPDTLIWKVPIISWFAPTELFLAPEHQIWRGSQLGEVKIRGDTYRKVLFFNMSDAPDLNEHYIASCVNQKVQLVTLEYVLGEQIRVVDTAIKSDGIHEKFIEAFGGKKGPDPGMK
jgi:hypothetical protein